MAPYQLTLAADGTTVHKKITMMQHRLRFLVWFTSHTWSYGPVPVTKTAVVRNATSPHRRRRTDGRPQRHVRRTGADAPTRSSTTPPSATPRGHSAPREPSHRWSRRGQRVHDTPHFPIARVGASHSHRARVTATKTTCGSRSRRRGRRRVLSSCAAWHSSAPLSSPTPTKDGYAALVDHLVSELAESERVCLVERESRRCTPSCAPKSFGGRDGDRLATLFKMAAALVGESPQYAYSDESDGVSSDDENLSPSMNMEEFA